MSAPKLEVCAWCEGTGVMLVGDPPFDNIVDMPCALCEGTGHVEPSVNAHVRDVLAKMDKQAAARRALN